jgi:hypothetical protein
MSQQMEPVKLPTPGRVGQGTAVEQTRAAAEVLAAVRVAQECPRDLQLARVMMQDSCRQPYLAERAFYRFPRGGQTVTGPTVHLARELARCFGNVQYGIAELRRDDEYGQSEMLAFAWDVQTNTRTSNTFIVPHLRDKKGGPERLVDVRDIYENNANNGARRMRQAIYAILPPFFTEEAQEICRQTLKDGGGRPLAHRIGDAIAGFRKLGVDLDRIEAKLGRPKDRWDDMDVAQLGITFRSIEAREVRIEDEFPDERVDAEQIAGARPVTVPPVPPSADAEAAAEAGWPEVPPIPGGE